MDTINGNNNSIKNNDNGLVLIESNNDASAQAHSLPKEISNCYCGNPRKFESIELLCHKCKKWFHEQCISVSLGRMLPYMTTYIFTCKICNLPSKSESLKRVQANFSQICQTTIANLMLQYSNEKRIAFSKDKEIIPFIDANWDILSNKQRPLKNTWHGSVLKVMLKETETFVNGSGDSDDILFALRVRDLSKIAPNYESQKFKELNGGNNLNSSSRSLRGLRKRTNQNDNNADSAHSNKKLRSEFCAPKLPATGYPTDFPVIKEDYRYILAEPDENAPFKKEFQESQEFNSKTIPSWLGRKFMPTFIGVSINDRARCLKISEDRKTITGDKGYSSFRTTHAVSTGVWYYEVQINEAPPTSATRIGWAQDLAQLNAPIGYDKFGYSWRSRKGTVFHSSIGKHFAEEGFGSGDILGCLIYLPPPKDDPYCEIPLLPDSFKDRPLIKMRNYIFFEEKEEKPKIAEANLRVLEGSKIVFYKNGVKIGTAFENIYGGYYYPAAGLYKEISITLNFGPDFTYPPNDEFKDIYRPICERVLDALMEQTLSDLVYLVENEDKLNLE
uniref:Set1/Ash2 histone methyltransferase complex subunit ASH2 n=1 Tax=Sarcoptes scabiei TaxID=52283 RepID=A0A834VC68_SARSC